MIFLRPVSLLLLVWQIGGHSAAPPAASPSYFRAFRALQMKSGIGPACAVLDAAVLAHASSSLKDVRLYSGATEIPYALTLSETVQQESEEAKVLNLGLRTGRIVFDLEMPRRAYTTVTLDLGATDFIATATVFGSDAAGSKPQTGLGSFTLFDLSGQHLSHSTSIALQESSFPYLHIELALRAAAGGLSKAPALLNPAIVKSATVPPSREAQTIFTTVAQTASPSQQARQSVARFRVPVRVPIERISFALRPGYKGNFSRNVEVKAHADAVAKGETEGLDAPDAPDLAGSADLSDARDEGLAGTISRVHMTEAGREISEENLTVQTAIGSNMQRPAVIEVAIDNGDDAPLPVSAVRLEMRQRKICFDAAIAGPAPRLYYGDAALDAPIYDYAKLFRPVANPIAAQLEDEQPNPEYRARGETRSFTEQHPELLWIGLLGVVCILAVTAFRSAKRLH